MNQPLLLDLFCGAGGAGEGYARAGYRVVGCDIDPKPLRHNPHECYEGDALDVLDTLAAGGEWRGIRITDVSAIHLSPPCQDFTRAKHLRPRKVTTITPRLIAPCRARLARLAVPWVMENVPDASCDMPDGVMLCGTMFGLKVRRHRLFSSSLLLFAAAKCNHYGGCVSVRKAHAEYLGKSDHVYTDRKGYVRYRPISAPADVARSAMGIPWMPLRDLGEAIPPAYTEFIGRQLLSAYPEGATA